MVTSALASNIYQLLPMVPLSASADGACQIAWQCDLAGQFLQLLQELCPREGVEVVARQLGMAAASVLSDQSSSSLFSSFASTTQGVIARAKASISQGQVRKRICEEMAVCSGVKMYL